MLLWRWCERSHGAVPWDFDLVYHLLQLLVPEGAAASQAGGS